MSFLHYKEFMKCRYGEPLYRIPVDLGLSCPHRDNKGGGGCAFCAEDGGRARQILGAENLKEQVFTGIDFARQRYDARKFMLYIQTYTGTFSDPSYLQNCIAEILSWYDFTAITIGTRPDCLKGPIMSMLAELNQQIETWLELGIQTTHGKTLRRINRGHDWTCSHRAIQRLAEAGLPVVPHIIIGLPGETREDWNRTAVRLAELPIAGIKLHNLHVIKDTKLAAEFAAEPFPVLDEHQYAKAAIEFIRRLPPGLPIIRLTTDTEDKRLVAPKWTMSKGRFIQFLERQMRFNNVKQGDLYQTQISKTSPAASSVSAGTAFEPLTTEDGSVTFWSRVFKEHYHAKIGALTEAMAKFIDPAGLRKKLPNKDIQMLDVCFGLGYNTLAACDIAELLQEGRLNATALEIDANVIAAAAGHVQSPQSTQFDWNACLATLNQGELWQGSRCSIKLLVGDARATLDDAMAYGGPFDIVLLDAFSTQRNAELWTLDFLRRLKAVMSQTGVLLTYCAALPVRSALLQAGFHVGETPPIGRKRGGTIAAMQAEAINIGLSEKELSAISTTKRGIPYRDPQQTWTNRQILRQREQVRAM